MKASAPILDVHYAGPAHPGTAIEVVRLSDLFSRVDDEHFVPPQRPRFHLLALVTAGAGSHMIDFRVHRCHKGTLLHVRPGQIQRFIRTPPFEAIVVLFSPAAILRDGALEQVTGHRSFVDMVLPGGSTQIASRHLSQVRSDFERLRLDSHDDRGSPLRIRLVQHSLHVLLLRLASSPSAGERPPDGFNAASRIVARFQNELEKTVGLHHRVDGFAARLGCSTRTLHASCFKVRGVGPKSMIEERLVLEAQRLLAHTSLPIDQVGAELGFDEPANFVRMFKRVAATSPGRFRSSLTK